MGPQGSPALAQPRWAIVLHGHDHREANVRRARIQLRRRFPHLSESHADDQVRDHYEGILERVAAPRNPDGSWPPGAFQHDDLSDGLLEALDGWIVNALLFDLGNYQRDRANRHQSFEGAREDGRETAIGGWASSSAVDPARVAEARAMLRSVLSDAPPLVDEYVDLAHIAGLKKSEIQRRTMWSDRRYKQVKAQTEAYLTSVRDAYRALPVLLARWLVPSSNSRVRVAAPAGVGAAGAVKAGAVIVASVAAVGGAIELHSRPARHHSDAGARHAQAQATSQLPVAAPAITASAPRRLASPHATTAAKRRRSAQTQLASVPHALAYLGSPTSQGSPPRASTNTTSVPVVQGAPPKSGGLAYLGGP